VDRAKVMIMHTRQYTPMTMNQSGAVVSGHLALLDSANVSEQHGAWRLKTVRDCQGKVFPSSVQIDFFSQ
jgi:hypothetical protein